MEQEKEANEGCPTQTENQVAKACPIEQYRFHFDEDERKAINKKQMRTSLKGLCTYIGIMAFFILFQIINALPEILFGILLGLPLICSFTFAFSMINFKKNEAANLATMKTRESVWSVFEDRVKVEVYDQGNKISEMTESYDNIKKIQDVGEHLLLNIAGLYYVVRRSDLVENSFLLSALSGKLKAAKERNQKSRRALWVLLICVILLASIVLYGKLSEGLVNGRRTSVLEARLSEIYDEHELLENFYIGRGVNPSAYDKFLLVGAGDKIDIVCYDFTGDVTEDECDIYVCVKGLTPEMGSIPYTKADGTQTVICLCANKKDIPKGTIFKKSFSYKGQTLYFCMTQVNL